MTESHEALLREALVSLAELKITAAATLAEQKKTNGRVGSVEEWIRKFELQEAKEAGIVLGRTGLQRKQMGILVGILGMGGTFGGIVAQVASRFVA